MNWLVNILAKAFREAIKDATIEMTVDSKGKPVVKIKKDLS